MGLYENEECSGDKMSDASDASDELCITNDSVKCLSESVSFDSCGYHILPVGKYKYIGTCKCNTLEGDSWHQN